MKRILHYLFLAVVLPCLCLSGCAKDDGGVKMTARVTAIGERIEVEVLDSEYTSGPHWVITDEDTRFVKNGRRIGRSDIAVGDTVEIYYNGQVMLSYPPQIVATKISVIN